MLVRTKSSHHQRLFPFERVFEAADDVLNLALYLVGLALRLQLGVTDGLADHLLDCTFELLRRSDNPALSKNLPPMSSRVHSMAVLLFRSGF